MAENKNPYEDILNLPHHISQKHPQMSIINRAAQFMPFQALSGYGDAISETARMTSEKRELSENSREDLDESLQQLIQLLQTRQSTEKVKVTVSFFKKDSKKDGGSYETITAGVKKIDIYYRKICFLTGIEIPIEDIVDLQIEEESYSQG